jgi:biotin transporter BioY
MAKKTSKAKGNKSGQKKLMLTFMVLTSVALLPTTVIFFIGMMPTIAIRLSDRSRQRTRVLTIGFMNFASCFPFWFQLMQKGHKFDVAVNIILDPMNLSIMYGGAVAGYLIEWSLSGFVAGMMVQKGRRRLENIKKMQDDMVQRWGREVSGEIPLDIHGFPVETKEK